MKYTPRTFLRIFFVSCLLFSLANARNRTSSLATIADFRIYDMAHDSLGFLWVASARGIMVYDGYTYRSCGTNSLPSPEFQGTPLHILTLRHELWIGSDRGLYRFDPVTNTTQEYLVASHHPLQITDMVSDSHGDLWVGTAHNGLLKWDRQTDQLSPASYTNGSRIANDPTLQSISTLYVDEQQNLWIGSQRHGVVWCYNIPERSLERRTISAKSGAPHAITRFGNNELWVGTDNGLICYDLQKNQQAELPASIQNTPELKSNMIQCIELIDNNNYVLTSTKRVYKYCISTGETTPLNIQSDSEPFLGTINCLLSDQHGHLWIGTAEEGVVGVNSGKASLRTAPFRALLHGEPVTACSEDSLYGRLWLGTRYNGLYMQSSAETTLNLREVDPSTARALEHQAVTALLCSRHGEKLWIGTTQQLYVAPLTANGLHEGVAIQGVGAVTQIIEDRKQNIWVASLKGLYLFEKGITARRRTLVHDRSIMALAALDNGQVAYAQHGRDLMVTDMNGTVHKPLLAEKLLDGERLANCSALLQATDGSLWIGDNQLGILHFTPSSQTVERLSEKLGIVGDRIVSLAQDRNNDLWVATAMNLLRYDPRHRQTYGYHHDDGLGSGQLSDRALIACADGSMIVGGNRGAYRYIRTAQIGGYLPSVIIERLTTRPHDKGKAPETYSTAYQQQLALKHRNNSFTIDYTGIDFDQPSKLEYAYRLDNFDNNWIEAGSHRRATYTNLPSGVYRFRLKARNSDGDWGPERSVVIRIRNNFWQSGWAITLYICLAGCAAAYATRFLRKAAHDRLQMEASATQLAQLQQHQRDKEDHDQSVANELNSSLRLMHEHIALLQHNTWAGLSDARLIPSLAYNSGRLKRLVCQLDAQRSGSRDGRPPLQPMAIQTVVRDIFHAFRFRASARNIDYSLRISDEPIVVKADHDLFEKCFNNLISMVVDQTVQHGTLTITIETLSPQQVTAWCPDYDARMSAYTHFLVSCSVEGEQSTNPHIEQPYHAIQTLVQQQNGCSHMSLDNDHTLQIGFILECSTENTKLSDTGTSTHLVPSDPEPADETITPPQSDHPTILVVDDDTQIHAQLHEALHNSYAMIHAYDGAEALQMIRIHTPQVILSDIRMPEMDGMALCRTIKNDPQYSHCIFILLTAQEQTDTEGYRAGADAFIAKPFENEQLRSIISGQLNNRERLKNYFANLSARQKSENSEASEQTIPDTLSEIDRRFMEKLHIFIEKGIEDPEININTMAVELGFSRTSFYRKMKLLTDMSPNDYVRNFKMKKAARLLVEGNLSIAEISDQTGFGTQSHFSTAFKKFFGVSPKDYKEKWHAEHHKNHDHKITV